MGNMVLNESVWCKNQTTADETKLSETKMEDLMEFMDAPFCIEGIILPLIGCIGICGNLASIAHFGTRFKYKQNFHSYMLCLGIVDLFLILCSIVVHTGHKLSRIGDFFYDKTLLEMALQFDKPTSTNKTQVQSDPEDLQILRLERYYNLSSIYYNILIVVTPLISICISGSIYFHIAISIERYLVVCKPFFRIRFDRYQHRAIIILIAIIAFVFNMPKFFELKLWCSKKINLWEDPVTYETDECGDDNSWYVMDICPTELRQNQIYIYTMMCLDFLFMGVIPYVLIFLFNVLIIRQLIHNNNWSSTRKCQIRKSKNSWERSYFQRNHLEVVKESKYCMPTRHFHSGRLKRNDVLLAKLSLGIMAPYLIYQTFRMIPNVYEMTRVNMICL